MASLLLMFMIASLRTFCGAFILMHSAASSVSESSSRLGCFIATSMMSIVRAPSCRCLSSPVWNLFCASILLRGPCARQHFSKYLLLLFLLVMISFINERSTSIGSPAMRLRRVTMHSTSSGGRRSSQSAKWASWYSTSIMSPMTME